LLFDGQCAVVGEGGGGKKNLFTGGKGKVVVLEVVSVLPVSTKGESEGESSGRGRRGAPNGDFFADDRISFDRFGAVSVVVEGG